jgi:hypothetical protein
LSQSKTQLTGEEKSFLLGSSADDPVVGLGHCEAAQIIIWSFAGPPAPVLARFVRDAGQMFGTPQLSTLGPSGKLRWVSLAVPVGMRTAKSRSSGQ